MARMKIYLVGGAVRDRLLGRPVSERDFVVVGATPDELVARGFRPVGKDFPVFLHPRTGEQNALARLVREWHPVLLARHGPVKRGPQEGDGIRHQV